MEFVDLYPFRAVVAPAGMTTVARLPRCIPYGVAGRLAWFDQVGGGPWFEHQGKGIEIAPDGAPSWGRSAWVVPVGVTLRRDRTLPRTSVPWGGALGQRLVCQRTDAAALGMPTVAQAFSRPSTGLLGRVDACWAAVVALRAALLHRAHAAAADAGPSCAFSVRAA